MKAENINNYYTEEDLINFKKLKNFNNTKVDNLNKNQAKSHPECNATFQLLQAARFSLTILICRMLRLLISASTLFNATITSYESIIPFSYYSAAKNLCQHHNR